MQIYNDKICLRDFLKTDIEKRIYWETVDASYQEWDAPWEYEDLTDEEKEAELDGYVFTMSQWADYYAKLDASTPRSTFQIDTPAGAYIGWVNSYSINNNYEYTRKEGHTTVGIDIADSTCRGNSYGRAALGLFISYLLDCGSNDIYCQTWSGNERMIGLAKRLGFYEVYRKIGTRTVRGAKYDGLTLRLDLDKFEKVSYSKLT